MALPRDRALLVKAARLYYEQDLSQDQIAVTLGVSRSNVSRMLTDARSQGIVQIKIVEHAMRDTALERRIQELLPVRHVRVSRSGDSIDDFSSVGALGADALTERVRPNSTVGISWGSTLQAVVNAIDSDYLPGVQIVPLVGGMTALSSTSTGDDLVRTMATKMGASHSTVLAPVVVTSDATRDAFLNEPSISAVLEQARKSDIALVGIGSKHSSSTMDLLTGAGLPDATYDALMKDISGDICAQFFDINGEVVDHGWENRIIGIRLDELRRISHVIGVAAGAGKAAGVIGAARGGYVSELVLSSSCALAVVRMLDASKGVRAS
jgi:DNA-binding transcriptional regulator LsrR (DeoR family)